MIGDLQFGFEASISTFHPIINLLNHVSNAMINNISSAPFHTFIRQLNGGGGGLTKYEYVCYDHYAYNRKLLLQLITFDNRKLIKFT